MTPEESPVAALEAGAGTMREQLRRLVESESPTADLAAVRSCAEVLAEIGAEVTGRAPEVIEREGRPHLLWRLGEGPARVGILGHFDTVWPVGTLAAMPYRELDGRAHGPGVFDMKCGAVQALHAARAAGVAADLLFTSDEETGSRTSRGLIEELARGWSAALVAEPAHGGAVKVARKGVSEYRLHVEGREAHAGLEPEKGANALVALAEAILEAARMADPAAGTTVTPTLAAAGTAGNVVPAAATGTLDVRAATLAEQARVDAALRSLASGIEGTRLRVEGGPNRPPLERTASAALFELAARLHAGLGFGELRAVAVGGGSDGNFTAAAGIPTLDGLGAVGEGAHARHEHVVLAEIPRRAALLAALLRALA